MKNNKKKLYNTYSLTSSTYYQVSDTLYVGTLSQTLLGVQRAAPFAGVRGVPEKLLFLFAASGGEKEKDGKWQIPSPRKKCLGER